RPKADISEARPWGGSWPNLSGSLAPKGQIGRWGHPHRLSRCGPNPSLGSSSLGSRSLRSIGAALQVGTRKAQDRKSERGRRSDAPLDRKSTRLNSSHDQISYAVFCLKKKNESRFDAD